MVRPETLEQIGAEFQLLASEIGEPVPLWDFIEGTTSVFIHPPGRFTCPVCGPRRTVEFEGQAATLRCPGCGQIFFGRGIIEEMERKGLEVDLAGLVAHEFWHWHQFANNINQDRPLVREANARRFSAEWIQQRFPGQSTVLGLQDLGPGLAVLPLEPGIVVDGQLVPSEEIPELTDDFVEVLRRVPEITRDDMILFEEARKLIGRPPPISTARWIKFKLLFDGPSWPYKLWKDLRTFMDKFGFKAPPYTSVRRMIWMMNQLGLITLIRTEEGELFGLRHIYDITPGRVEDDAWNNPQRALYPPA